MILAMMALQKADSQTHFCAINDIAKIILLHKEKDICFLLSAICNAIIAKIFLFYKHNNRNLQMQLSEMNMLSITVKVYF